MNVNKLYPKLKLNSEIHGVTNNHYEVKTNFIYVSTNHNKD